MQKWPEEIYDYILDCTRFDDPLLAEMEERAQSEGFPIIGAHTAPWLYMLARLSGARKVYELGSGYGYSTWFFAKAVAENGGGEVVHTVWDETLSSEAQVNMERAGFSEQCRFIMGEAVAALKGEQPGWDIIFMDIDKEGYPTALPTIEEKLKPGGLLLVDNVLWSGRILDEANTEPATIAVREFNAYLKDSKHWEYLINPLRDGLGVARFMG